MTRILAILLTLATALFGAADRTSAACCDRAPAVAAPHPDRDDCCGCGGKMACCTSAPRGHSQVPSHRDAPAHAGRAFTWLAPAMVDDVAPIDAPDGTWMRIPHPSSGPGFSTSAAERRLHLRLSVFRD